MARTRPTVAVWKLASCDGCQLVLVEGERDLLELAEAVHLAHFSELSSRHEPGPYDLSLVEGSVSTAADAARIRAVRAASRTLVTIGACATSGGLQALRNLTAAGEAAACVYARPDYLDSLDRSTPVSDHVPVDLELPGCPVDRGQLLEVVTAVLAGRRPVLSDHSVCQQCKARGLVCRLVADDTPCLGPVTRAGCGALCPAAGRGCFGCFGASPTAAPAAFLPRLRAAAGDDPTVVRLLRTVSVGDPVFARAAESVEAGS